MYQVKTRNWNGSKRIKRLLDASLSWGVVSYSSSNQDVKYWLDTSNHLKAWGIFLYFLALSRWSGGWTYIVLPGHSLKPGYKSIN